MDVRLPNGTVIRGVPDGTPKHEVAMKAIRNGLATNADFGYDEAPSAASESGLENFAAGVGKGMVDTGRKAVNLLLPDSITPDFASDESIANARERDQDLMQTGAGLGGSIVGELVASAPVGMGAGAAAAKGARALSATSKGGKYLTRTLQRGAGRSAVEGGAVGSVIGTEEGDTGKFAAMGGAFGGVGTVLGKALGAGQMVKITNEAKKLQKLTGHFIPISQAAEAGMVKQFYNAFLANIPGVGGKVRGQYQKALQDLRRFAGEHAMPDTHVAHNLVNLTGKESVEEMMGKLSKYWDVAFDEIKPWQFTVTKADKIHIPTWVQKAVQAEVKSGMKIPQVGKDITGEELIAFKSVLGRLMKGPQKDNAVLGGIQTKLNSLMKRNLNPSGKGTGQAAQVLKNYEEASKYYPSWQAFKNAAGKAADNQNFSPAQLATAASKGGRTLVHSEKGLQQKVGELGVDALEDFPSRQGLFQTVAALGLGTGYVAGGLPGTAAALGVMIGGGRIMASKGLQKYLMGQTKFQRLNKAMFRKYRAELQKMGYTARQATALLEEKQ